MVKLMRRVQVPRRELYTITCKNNDCAKPIVLPLPIRDDSYPGQHLWPKDERPKNFLCRKCRHVYEYTPEDVQMSPGEDSALSEGLVDDTVYRIEAICGEQSCRLPVHILLTAPSWQQTTTIRHVWLDQDIHGDVRCSVGHATERVISDSVDIHQDPDWK
jgi:hypothetical protein